MSTLHICNCCELYSVPFPWQLVVMWSWSFWRSMMPHYSYRTILDIAVDFCLARSIILDCSNRLWKGKTKFIIRKRKKNNWKRKTSHACTQLKWYACEDVGGKGNKEIPGHSAGLLSSSPGNGALAALVTLFPVVLYVLLL